MTAASPTSITENTDFLSFKQLTKFAVIYGPRLIILGLVGYASLGFCYHIGLIGYITELAIPIIKNQVGYIGLGAVMPTFQWYLAWGVRVVSVILAECILESAWFLCRTIAHFISNWLAERNAQGYPSSLRGNAQS